VEFDTDIFSGKMPANDLMGAVALLLPGGHIGAHLLNAGDAPVQALLDQAVDFYPGMFNQLPSLGA
jgi:hypothetical protein